MGVDITIGSGKLKTCTRNPAEQIDARLKAFRRATDIRRKNKHTEKRKEATGRASKSNITCPEWKSPNYILLRISLGLV